MATYKELAEKYMARSEHEGQHGIELRAVSATVATMYATMAMLELAEKANPTPPDIRTTWSSQGAANVSDPGWGEVWNS